MFRMHHHGDQCNVKVDLVCASEEGSHGDGTRYQVPLERHRTAASHFRGWRPARVDLRAKEKSRRRWGYVLPMSPDPLGSCHWEAAQANAFDRTTRLDAVSCHSYRIFALFCANCPYLIELWRHVWSHFLFYFHPEHCRVGDKIT